MPNKSQKSVCPKCGKQSCVDIDALLKKNMNFDSLSLQIHIENLSESHHVSAVISSAYHESGRLVVDACPETIKLVSKEGIICDQTLLDTPHFVGEFESPGKHTCTLNLADAKIYALTTSLVILLPRMMFVFGGVFRNGLKTCP